MYIKAVALMKTSVLVKGQKYGIFAIYSQERVLERIVCWGKMFMFLMGQPLEIIAKS